MSDYAPRSSLVDTAVEIMREQIVAGRWKIGERIPTEPKLADMLQVSRGTVREAVKILAVSGQLEVRQGSGTYLRAVCDTDDTLRRLKRASLRDHFEVRCSLEVEAARLASRRRTEDDIVRLRHLLDGCGRRPEDDTAALVARDLAFHQALVAVARNPALEELYRWFSAAVSDTIAAMLETDLPEPDLCAHLAIVDAIAAGDPDTAELAVRKFMAPVIAELETLLARDIQEQGLDKANGERA